MARSKKIKGEIPVPQHPIDPLQEEVRRSRLEECRAHDADQREFLHYQHLPNLLFEGRYFREPIEFAHLLCEIVAEMKRRGNAIALSRDDIYRKAGRELIALADRGAVEELASRVMSLSVAFSDPLGRHANPADSRLLQSFWCDDPNDAGKLLILHAGAPGCHYLRIGIWLDLAALAGIEDDDGVFYDPKLPLEFDPPMPFPRRCSRMSVLLREYVSKRAQDPGSKPPLFVVRGLERIRRHAATASRLPADALDLKRAPDETINAILNVLDEMARTAAFQIEPSFPAQPPHNLMESDAVGLVVTPQRPVFRFSPQQGLNGILVREGNRYRVRLEPWEAVLDPQIAQDLWVILLVGTIDPTKGYSPAIPRDALFDPDPVMFPESEIPEAAFARVRVDQQAQYLKRTRKGPNSGFLEHLVQEEPAVPGSSPMFRAYIKPQGERSWLARETRKPPH